MQETIKMFLAGGRMGAGVVPEKLDWDSEMTPTSKR
jgi:hypothetical protein